MATLPRVCEVLSGYDGRGSSSLRVVGNALRDAGVMSVGGIGRGALHVGPDDAAALVLASLWTDSPCASHRAIEVLSGLKRKPAPPVPNLPRPIAQVIEFPTLGDAVAGIIEFGAHIRRHLGGLHLELTVTRPVPTATLALVDDFGRRLVAAEWQVDAAPLARGYYLPETREAVDRRHATTITSETLFALSDAVRPEMLREDA